MLAMTEGRNEHLISGSIPNIVDILAKSLINIEIDIASSPTTYT